MQVLVEDVRGLVDGNRRVVDVLGLAGRHERPDVGVVRVRPGGEFRAGLDRVVAHELREIVLVLVAGAELRVQRFELGAGVVVEGGQVPRLVVECVVRGGVPFHQSLPECLQDDVGDRPAHYLVLAVSGVPLGPASRCRFLWRRRLVIVAVDPADAHVLVVAADAGQFDTAPHVVRGPGQFLEVLQCFGQLDVSLVADHDPVGTDVVVEESQDVVARRERSDDRDLAGAQYPLPEEHVPGLLLALGHAGIPQEHVDVVAKDLLGGQPALRRSQSAQAKVSRLVADPQPRKDALQDPLDLQGVALYEVVSVAGGAAVPPHGHRKDVLGHHGVQQPSLEVVETGFVGAPAA
mmetsp:Transcript_24048/g.52680  ORF Transcript_24048/g.52680 Transcript_24048/m.52680 type:complete len:349 (+) Transcript_24048:926-1972(+)